MLSSYKLGVPRTGQENRVSDYVELADDPIGESFTSFNQSVTEGQLQDICRKVLPSAVLSRLDV